MPVNYITAADITNKIFNSITEGAKAPYISKANSEVEDLAIRLGVKVSAIVTPVHNKIKRYATQYALAIFAEDNIGFNNVPLEEDKYNDLFKRSQYLMQESKPEISTVLFTGEEQTADNRSVRSTRLVRT